MSHGRLRASRSSARRDRFFGNAPGIYAHSGITSERVGIVWGMFRSPMAGSVWRPNGMTRLVDQPVSVAAFLGTDQWVQREDSARLVALWLSVRASTTEDGWEVQRN